MYVHILMPTQHSWALFSGNLRVREYDQPATCVMKTGSERQKNARMAIQSHERKNALLSVEDHSDEVSLSRNSV